VNGVVAWVGPVGWHGPARQFIRCHPVQNFSVRRRDVSQSRHSHFLTSKGFMQPTECPPQAAVMSGEMSEGSRDIRVVEPVSNSPRETGGGIGQSWPVQRISARPVGEPYATSLIFRSSRPIAAEQLYQQRTVIRSETKRPAGEGA
jgi:hypothetical protein